MLLSRASLGSLLMLTALVACSKAADDDATSDDDVVTAKGPSAETVLKSIVYMEGGCVATKVGPKHLLVAARCVVGNATIAAGKSVAFTLASKSDNAIVTADPGADGVTPAKKAAVKGTGTLAIATVEVHASFAAKCKADACAFQTVGASDAPDIAVIVAKDAIEGIPSLPVDLDTVNAGDSLLVVGTGCTQFGQTKTAKSTVTKSTAAPASVVNHQGSAYQTAPQYTSRLNVSYVTSAGIGWKPDAPKVCVADVGAPVVRGNAAAVAGILSNFTTFGADEAPVTLAHTRVDEASRFKVGAWLASLGVETLRSCGEAKCTKHGYDGGVPTSSDGGTKPTKDGGTKPDAATPSDAGASDASETVPDAGTSDAGEAPPPDTSSPIPGGEGVDDGEYGSGASGDDEPSSTDAGIKKEPSKEAGEQRGCSSTPGAVPSGSFGILAGMGLVLLGLRRRRR